MDARIIKKNTFLNGNSKNEKENAANEEVAIRIIVQTNAITKEFSTNLKNIEFANKEI
jgi:hypothetical protein